MRVLLFAWALVMIGCGVVPVEPVEPESCSIVCNDPNFPIPCRVERTEGPFFTCTDTANRCEGVPGEVCEGSDEALTCVSDDGSRADCAASPRCGWNEACSTCCPDDFRIACAPGVCGASELACAPYGLCE